MPSYANAYDYNKNDFLNGEDFKVGQAPVVRIEAYNGKAGSYKLTPYSAQDFGRNYVVTYVSGFLKVSKAALTILADNKESVYGKELEELTYTATTFTLAASPSGAITLIVPVTGVASSYVSSPSAYTVMVT